MAKPVGALQKGDRWRHDPDVGPPFDRRRVAPPRAAWARLSDWLGVRWCGLTTGHYFVRTTTPTRLSMQCWYCGRESPGWTLSLVPPEDRT